MDSEFEDEEFDKIVQDYCRQVMEENNKQQQLQNENQVMQEKLEVRVTQTNKSQQSAQIINLSQFSYVPQENQNKLTQPNKNQSQPLIINQKVSQGISQKEKSSQLQFSQNQCNKNIFTVKFINADTFSVQYVNGSFSQEQIEYFKNKFITVNFQKAQSLEASIFEYESIIQEFGKQKNNSITQPPLAIFKFFKYQIPFSEKVVNYDYSKEQIKSFKDLPEELQNKLYTFQKEGVNYVLGRFGRALIGDEMGVGKTMQAIASVTAYYSEWPVLVLCPSMLCCNWRNEILNHLGFLVEANKVQIIKTGSTKFQKNKNFYIISYDMAKNMAQAILAEDIKVIICDESHYLKEPQTQRFKNICPILQGCRRLILLSGTPMISRPKEIFTQISCIRPDIFNNFKVFGQRYCDPKPDK